LAVKVNLEEQFGRVDHYWSPRTVAAVNDYDVNVLKVQGEFVWHQHDETDELVLVTAGQLRLHLQDHDDVVLSAGELFVVPRGMRHFPVADEEAQLVFLWPRATGAVSEG
jgi:mannose-6-phosphate isomerase-like protein (cupin superfamily)